MPISDQIDRAFVRIAEGQVHYRTAGKSGEAIPLFLLHASPSSSVSLESTIIELAPHRLVIAPDTLGNGDSAKPAPAEPDVAYFADTMDRACDALGHDQVDVYGFHTGAHIALEWALLNPSRVRRLIFDGFAVVNDETREELLANYAPAKSPTSDGSQFHWAWNFLRDQMIFYPYYKRDSDHLREGGDLDPGRLHTMTVEVLKALTSYHLPYRAVFNHDLQSRLPLLGHDALCISRGTDPLNDGVAYTMETLRNGQVARVEGPDKPAALAKAILDFTGRSSDGVQR